MISVIMPSYLGEYKYAAADRDKKLVRAINSVLYQSYADWELMVVADGCPKTVEIVKGFNDPRIRGLMIDKKPLFSGTPRNTGIYYAKGEIMVYLDIDDMFGENHLKKIVNSFGDSDWVWFDDRSFNVNKQRKGFIENPNFEDFHIHGVNVHVRGKCGTSNIAHKKFPGAYWRAEGTYYHDWVFINILKGISKNYKKIEPCEYLICHVPHLLDI
jgi:glycosyltransferase involved in cell wall biosynthesis